MEHPPQNPDRPVSHGEEEIPDTRRKPTGFDEIYPRLKEIRKRALRELYKRGGEASTTVLKARDGGNIPDGSFEMHIAWLRGERRNGDSFQWWPGDVPPLVVMDRMTEREYGETRMFTLTDYGEQFVQFMLDEEGGASEESIQELRMVVQGHGNQLSTLADRIEDLENRTKDKNPDEDADGGESPTDDLDELKQQLASIEERVEKHERYIHTLLDHISAE